MLNAGLGGLCSVVGTRTRLVANAMLLAVGFSYCAHANGPPAVSSAGAGGGPKLFSVYKDVSQFIDPVAHVISIFIDGKPRPVVQDGNSILPPQLRTLTWASASGECGREHWGGLDAQKLADANIEAFNRAGINYIVSTGGEADSFTCATDEGMEQFIARYKSPRLIGFDFDIEHKQSGEIIDALVRRVHAAQRRHPGLRFSFTLATHAGSDGSARSLNATGKRVMKAIRAARLEEFYVNLMVMNYGKADPEFCVVASGACDMGRSAMQAALNLQQKYGVPLDRIELTAMIGINDVTANVFKPIDAVTVAKFANERGIGGVYFWSLDRDGVCAAPTTAASPHCHGLDGLPRFAFTRAFLDALR